VLRTPEILAYVQSHVVVDGAAYDGITEIHWPDFAAAMRGMNSREMTVEQTGDAANFAAPGSVETDVRVRARARTRAGAIASNGGDGMTIELTMLVYSVALLFF
jgi:hypothetical protein